MNSPHVYLKLRFTILLQRATRICYSTCTVVNNALPFSISGPLAPLASAKDPAACSPDFLMIPNGFDSAIATPTVFADRYCGNVLNPGAANTATSATVCCKWCIFTVSSIRKTKAINNVVFVFNFLSGSQGFQSFLQNGCHRSSC